MSNAKADRFQRVASKRVQKLMDGLLLLGNCSNRNNYEYTEREVEHMFSEISKALRACEALYRSQSNKSSKSGFKF